ncbi:NAD(P)-binding protein [Saccharopolyspora spinosa]|uniref:NAD(P)-binding protein n=1 Tax=Saccharopolyspora spinosa TaxID=60894 RepID=UPI0002F486D1|nr:NAD(P)-binding protein [Saccharopolyspora spinosa]
MAGAGPGGLALACGLREHGVEVRVGDAAHIHSPFGGQADRAGPGFCAVHHLPTGHWPMFSRPADSRQYSAESPDDQPQFPGNRMSDSR